MNTALSTTHHRQIVTVLQNKQIAYAGLFGSRAKKTASTESDYDILIEFLPSIRYSLFDLIDIQEELEDILHTKVDLVTTKALSPLIKREVLKTVQPIYDHR